MKYAQRIMICIKRNKIYLYLLAIVLILSQVVFLSYFIHKTNDRAIIGLHQKIGARVITTLDWDEIEDGYELFPYEDIRAIGKQSEVKAFDYRNEVILDTKNIEKIGVEGVREATDITFIGIQYAQMMDIEMKTMELISGRVFTQDEINNNAQVMLISEQMRLHNNLQVGDTVQFEYFEYDEIEATEFDHTSDNSTRTIRTKTPYVFEIIGTYHKQALHARGEKDKEYTSYTNSNLLNSIYVSGNLVEQMQQLDTKKVEGIAGDVTYLLYDAKDIEQFIETAQKYVPESYMFVDMKSMSEQMEGMLQTSRSLSTMIFTTSVLLGIVISMLVLFLVFKHRRREFGIYLALGISKRGLIAQVLSEIFVVTLVGIALSFTLLQFIMPSMTGAIIHNEIMSSREKQHMPIDGIEKFEGVGSIDAYIKPAIQLEDYIVVGVGVLLIILGSTLLLLYQIIKYPVKDILLE
ncbi:hypothetical protein AwErysi_07780 [Erysipelotrichaceae bacterium]|nr:hypothetical protein AwErysi_07780 [Erysipelotrichaceae bacterium]